MAKHWSEVLACNGCGMRFRSYGAEARHRHNFPILCKRPRNPKKREKLKEMIKDLSFDELSPEEKEKVHQANIEVTDLAIAIANTMVGKPGNMALIALGMVIGNMVKMGAVDNVDEFFKNLRAVSDRLVKEGVRPQ